MAIKDIIGKVEYIPMSWDNAEIEITFPPRFYQTGESIQEYITGQDYAKHADELTEAFHSGLVSHPTSEIIDRVLGMLSSDGWFPKGTDLEVIKESIIKKDNEQNME